MSCLLVSLLCTHSEYFVQSPAMATRRHLGYRSQTQLDRSILLRGVSDWIAGKDPFFDRFSKDNLLVDESVDSVLGHTVVPIAFGVNHKDRSAFADSQALHLGPVASTGAIGEREFAGFELVLEFLPSCGS